MRRIKNILLKIYTYPLLNPEKVNIYQKRARDVEWEAIQSYLKKGKFLDIGCGSGYAMEKAYIFGCESYGIDPAPGEHGVGRDGSNFNINTKNIITGNAENLPYDNMTFDVIFCSHVLEHVSDVKKSLCEMKRVLKYDGILIIGMPTAIMAFVSLISQWIFTTHIRFVNFFLSPFINTAKTKWWELFIPCSHSDINKTIIYDLINYRVRTWEKMVEKEFIIKKTLKPALYPYPNYRQLFKIKKYKYIGSSVFFICEKQIIQ